MLAAPDRELSFGLLGNHYLLSEQEAVGWLSLSCWRLGGSPELVHGSDLDSSPALHFVWLSFFLIDLLHF